MVFIAITVCRWLRYVFSLPMNCPATSGKKQVPALHCGANGAGPVVDEKLELGVQMSVDEIERHGRRILKIAGMAGG
jgi:hypothetical protein